MALDEIIGFTTATVSAWPTIIIGMSAIRKLAAEAADNGLLAPEIAAGISRVKSARTQGIRAWPPKGKPVVALVRRQSATKSRATLPSEKRALLKLSSPLFRKERYGPGWRLVLEPVEWLR